MDRILLLLWAVGLVFSACFTVFTLILALCLKGTARSVAVNLLLVTATCTTALLVGSSYVTPPPEEGEDKQTTFSESVKRWSDSLDEATRIEYAQRRWPVLKCATALEFPFRAPGGTFNSALERFERYHATKPFEYGTVSVIKDLLKEHNSREDIIDTPIPKQIVANLPRGWFKEQAIGVNARILQSLDPGYAVRLEQQRRAEGDRFAIVIAAYSLYYIAVVAAGLVVVSNSILWLTKSEHGPDPSVRLVARGKTVYSIFLIAIYGSLIGTIPAEIFVRVVPYSISKITSVALTALCGGVGLMAGGLIAARKMILKPSGLSISEAFPFQLKANEIPLRLKQGVLAFLAASSLSTIVWVIQWNLCGPISTKSTYNIYIPQLATDFHLSAVVLNVVAVAILAPISEEILCRGLLFGWLRRSHSLLAAAAISAACFAGIHFDVQVFPSLFVVGFVFALTYERTKSLVPSMIGHSLHNLAMVVSVFLVR